MLIGSNSGLTQYNLAENTFSTIGYNVLFPQGLNDGIVYSILKDREGGIWVGTNAGGINYLTPGSIRSAIHRAKQVPRGKSSILFVKTPTGRYGSEQIIKGFGTTTHTTNLSLRYT